MIPYGFQDIRKEDIDAVIRVLQSDFLTQGPMVPVFEKDVAQYCQAEYAVAVNSGTSALHIACLALGVGNGDLVWTSPISFVASANCALYCGAEVDFVDIDIKTANISIAALEQKLRGAEKKGRLPKVLIPVHFAGNPCEMKLIRKFSQKYGFKIIEDGCHALGGRYDGKPVGNCRYSDITVFSFHPVKNITTGEGGMAVTRDYNLAEKMRMLRAHGITKDIKGLLNTPGGFCSHQQLMLGFNYRMSDIEVALGISQFKRIEEYVVVRHALAAWYDEWLKKLPVQSLRENSNGFSGRHLYVIRFTEDKTRENQVDIIKFFHNREIMVQLHYMPIHIQPFFEKMGFKPQDFPRAMQYYQTAITLPLYPGLRKEQQKMVVETLEEALSL